MIIAYHPHPCALLHIALYCNIQGDALDIIACYKWARGHTIHTVMDEKPQNEVSISRIFKCSCASLSQCHDSWDITTVIVASRNTPIDVINYSSGMPKENFAIHTYLHTYIHTRKHISKHTSKHTNIHIYFFPEKISFH